MIIPTDRPLTEAEVLTVHEMPYETLGPAYQRFRQEKPGVMIHLNPYRARGALSKATASLGYPIYHTGLVIGFDIPWSQGPRKEVSFGADGIFWVKFRALQDFKREAEREVMLGICTKPEEEIRRIIKEMEEDYPEGSYKLFEKNCHDFCNDLADRLGVARIPSKYTKISTGVAHCLQSLRDHFTPNFKIC